MIRRLQLPDDEPLLREASRWDARHPSWYRDMDKVFNSGTEDDFIALAQNSTNAMIGVFDNNSLIGVILVQMPEPYIHEGHLLARRGADKLLLTTALVTTISDLFNLGMVEAFCWVAERNTPVRQICDRIGMIHDGVVMWRGSYRGRVIKWLRYSIRREWVMEVAA